MNRTRIFSLVVAILASATFAGDAMARGFKIKVGGSSGAGSSTARGSSSGGGSTAPSGASSGNTGSAKNPSKGGNGDGGTTVIFSGGSGNSSASGGSSANTGSSGPGTTGVGAAGSGSPDDRKTARTTTAAANPRGVNDCARIGDPTRRDECAQAKNPPAAGTPAAGATAVDPRSAPAPTIIRGSAVSASSGGPSRPPSRGSSRR